MNKSFAVSSLPVLVLNDDLYKGRKKKDDPKTPAKPKERLKGSKVNKPGSADTGSGITLSSDIITGLKGKLKAHNDKYKDVASKKTTLRALKAVYRRGAGAFSTSHRPSVSSRNQWAMARVNAFLHLLRTGRPKNPKYVTDNDLLPKKHPRKTSKGSVKKSIEGCNLILKSHK